MTLLMSLALAGPGQSGTLLPGARPLPSPAYVGVAGIGGNVENKGLSGGAGFDFGIGTRDVSFQVHGHSWGIPDVGGSTLIAGGLRVQLVDEEQVRVAGVLGAAYVRNGRFHVFPGLALETGSEKVRFDLTLMPWSLAFRHSELAWVDEQPRGRWRLAKGSDWRWSHGGMLPLGTIGVAIPVPSGADNRVRFGFPELVAWHHTSERLYFDLGGVLFGATLGPHFKIGALLGRFDDDRRR